MWSDDDRIWVKNNYPSLRQIDSNTFEGRLSFRMLRLNGEFIINPPIESVANIMAKDYLYIFDSYQIRIEWKNDRPPMVFEVGGRLADVAKRYDIKNFLDMHQYQETGALCLASPMAIKRAFSSKVITLDVIIENFVIPYLFAQSHFAKTKKWIWDNLSHGFWGLIEWLGRQRIYYDHETQETYELLWLNGRPKEIAMVLGTRCRGYKKCSCGSGSKSRDCHPDRQLGLARIRGAIHRKIIKI